MANKKTFFRTSGTPHIVTEPAGEPALLYIDLHLIHEVTSPQAFEGLRLADRTVRRPDRSIATVDHNVPTIAADRLIIQDAIASKQIETLRRNCKEFGIELFDVDSKQQGIVHIIGPELGFTKPGMTIVCGDSHTSTHGAFGALAFGIGTSEVEHVLATQCLPQSKPKTFRISVEGELPRRRHAKDIALGHHRSHRHRRRHRLRCRVCRLRHSLAVMEGRMTVCNMSIESGARAGMIAPDETTFAYLKGRPQSPQGRSVGRGRRTLEVVALRSRCEVRSRTGHRRPKELTPFVTWGTTSWHGGICHGAVPTPAAARDDSERRAYERALEYMALEPGTQMENVPIDRVFIGSCTNARIEDLRAAAKMVSGYKVNTSVGAMVVPGSQQVKAEAEKEGLDRVFREAGFEWREPGCSMCLGMNPDILEPGERCASTSNRNFEGRQGRGGRTHLVSPSDGRRSRNRRPLYRCSQLGVSQIP